MLFCENPHTINIILATEAPTSSMANLRSLRSLFKTIALLAAIFLLILGFGFVRYNDHVLWTQPISTENLSAPSEGQYSFVLVS